ncbi:roadblock/LC7 domain-containing protein [Actinomadura barringtoniae]|uniref:roadblock/LC7 domain-containing protein n=1 Tax=Actinomadura barringtoniae TaxID=1427535 RepID=UPI0027DCD0AA|nr:roadblock/LC7 domain-containing protein [Actinomadura barringtoniae]
MTAQRRRLGELIERLTKVTVSDQPEDEGAHPPDSAVVAELATLRERVAGLVGSLVASSDGLLIAHDLPVSIEPAGMAALTASGLALSHRITNTAHGGAFHEVVIRGVDGYVVIYSAGITASLTVLAAPDVNVGRLHLESRPVARRIAERLAFTAVAPGARADHRNGKEKA